MANERLNIPQTLKVGFNERGDTYTGKLAYVTTEPTPPSCPVRRLSLVRVPPILFVGVSLPIKVLAICTTPNCENAVTYKCIG